MKSAGGLLSRGKEEGGLLRSLVVPETARAPSPLTWVRSSQRKKGRIPTAAGVRRWPLLCWARAMPSQRTMWLRSASLKRDSLKREGGDAFGAPPPPPQGL